MEFGKNNMLTFVNKYASNKFSQNGEDGIIAECLKRMGIDNGNCCEIGAHDGIFCSNTYNLRKNNGWYGLLIEADEKKWDDLLKNATENSNSTLSFATEKNVNNLLAPFHYNLLSIDIDGCDILVWKAYEGKPDIVIIEINSSLPPDKDYFNPVSGCSYKLMVETGIAKGYFLLCHTGNCVFVLNKYRHLFPEIKGDGLTNWKEYFDTQWL